MSLLLDSKCEILLNSLSKTVMEAPPTDTFLNYLCVETFSDLGAFGIILGHVRKQGVLELVGTFGYGDESVEPFTEIPLWVDTPITDCVRSKEVIALKSYEEVIKKYPDLAAFESNRRGMTISIPIISNNVVIGALGISCSEFPDFSIFESENWLATLNLVGIYLKFIVPVQKSKENFTNNQISLSERQLEIIQMFEEGLTAATIAKRLNVSVPTVKADITKIFKVFNTRSRDEVVELHKKVDQKLYSVS